MAGASLALRFAAIAVLCVLSCVSGQKVIRLGFLLPYPDGDTTVPSRLADEWISGVRVALEVLGPKYETNFMVEPFVQNSACDATAAAQAAQRLILSNVVGVVGPACSEAVKGANTVLKPNGIPFVSFAATADGFSTHEFKTMFRTVYPDRFQAAALGNVIQHFKFKKIRIFYTEETYGQGLATYLKDLLLAATPKPLVPDMIPVSHPGSKNPKHYEKYFTDRVPDLDSISVFATLPGAAENLFKAALALNLTQYPWWYLGADGAVAFDLVGEGEDLTNVTHAIQGEIGVGPYKGNYNPNSSPFLEFANFWAAKSHEEYPGLLSLNVVPRITEARAYVTYLVDAIWTFFEAFNNIVVVQGKEVSSDLILKCLRGSPQNCVDFNGATGKVAFNSSTGERELQAQAPEYSFFNLINFRWSEKSKWILDQYAVNPDLNYILRPGPLPKGWRDEMQKAAPVAVIPSEINAKHPPRKPHTFNPPSGSFHPHKGETDETREVAGSSSSGSKGPSGGAIAALVIVTLIAVALLGYGGWFFYKRSIRHPEHQQFVRML